MAASSNGAIAHNVRRIAHLDLAGAGQIYVQGRYAYIGHMKPPHGTTIVDVGDPKQPRVVGEIALEGQASHSHKVRVVGDVMITNVEQNDRHLLRRGAKLPEAEAGLTQKLGRRPSEAELAAELRVKPEQIPVLREGLAHPYDQGGFRIWNVSRPESPRLLAYVKTHGFGVHRFDMDANYAYISTEMAGYLGNILVIYEIRQPDQPKEIGRWWMKGQHIAGGETPTWKGYQNRVHHGLRQGDILWTAVWQAGLRAIDVSDPSRPRTIGSYDYHPPVREPTHTVLRVPFPVSGRQIAVVVDEEHDYIPGQPHAGLWVFDVGDLNAIKPLSTFHVSEMDSPWSRTPGGRFGAHQFQEHMEDTLVYCTWFSGGLRIIDVADPTLPREVGVFIPEPCNGHAAPQSNDVDTDARGLIYLMDRNTGFDILERTG
jgi:hypothetical protein